MTSARAHPVSASAPLRGVADQTTAPEPTLGPLLDVPSGQPVRLIDIIRDKPGPVGPAIRFRFLAPQIARDQGTMPFVLAEGDMAHLCETYALPLLAAEAGGDGFAQIIISFSDRVLAFGESDAAATQFIEAFRRDGARCAAELF